MKEFVFKTNTIFEGCPETRPKIDNSNCPATTSVLNIVPPFGDTIKGVLIEELLIHNEDMQVLRCAGLKLDPGQHQVEIVEHIKETAAHRLIFWTNLS